jgi:hypothetical protein
MADSLHIEVKVQCVEKVMGNDADVPLHWKQIPRLQRMFLVQITQVPHNPPGIAAVGI